MMNTKKENILKKLESKSDPSKFYQTEIRLTVASRLKEVLDNKNFKNNELKIKLNKKYASEITRYLSGTHNFTIDTLADIAFQLGIKVADLFEEYSEPTTQNTIWATFNSSKVKEDSFISESFSNSYQELINASFIKKTREPSLKVTIINSKISL